MKYTILAAGGCHLLSFRVFISNLTFRVSVRIIIEVERKIETVTGQKCRISCVGHRVVVKTRG